MALSVASDALAPIAVLSIAMFASARVVGGHAVDIVHRAVHRRLHGIHLGGVRLGRGVSLPPQAETSRAAPATIEPVISLEKRSRM